ncbi:DUF4012 domain-containing protein [Candidatus Woesebacteria bacterium]|nr:DUF4012 domain-containing protein [Candidatus Woesebacteria bacterium]
MWKKTLKILGIFFAVILISFSIFLFLAITSLQNNNFASASKYSSISLAILNPFSKLTFGKYEDLELLKSILQLIKEIPKISEDFNSAIKTGPEENYIVDLKKLSGVLKNVNEYADVFSKNLDKVPNSLKSKTNEIAQLSNLIPDLIKIIDNLADKDQKIIIVFQNSDEIRATGGFMGSYAVANIENGKIIDLTTEDIYDAEGQFEGFVEAPSGVKEYLSEGKGMRLSNANWDPDFPVSAKQILQFFALGNKTNSNTLIAINPEYAKKILEITDSITINDYNTIIDKNNITEVLRTRRDTFFPGSKQKKHLLSQLLTQLQLKISQLDNKKKIALINETVLEIENNNIQLYSNIEDIDQIYSKNKFRQEVKSSPDSEYLYLIESNVGINKANKNITRNVVIDADDFNTKVSINFNNSNRIPTQSNLTNLVEGNEINSDRSNHLGYINYQRIIVKPNYKIKSIKYNDQEILQWNENIYYNYKLEEFKEIGFLFTLKEEELATVVIELENSQKNLDKFYIQKQPGIPETEYLVKKNGKTISKKLTKNTLFEIQ